LLHNGEANAGGACGDEFHIDRVIQRETLGAFSKPVGVCTVWQHT
jgi:hypothetical protein